MSHLSPDTFIDLLDGAVQESAVPHLASCAACQQQLTELRATSQAALEAGVPEPSPLFWDHLSARVHDAVAAEPAQSTPWWRIDWSWRLAGLAGAAAATLTIVVALQGPRVGPVDAVPFEAPPATVATQSAAEQPLEPLADDESLGFVADLASNLDWDAVSELGFAERGGADRAVAEMNDGERAELQRLLNEAIGRGV